MSKKVTISATSSNPPIEYSIWQEGVMLYDWQTSNEFIVSETGDFIVKCRDALSGCTDMDTFTIESPIPSYTYFRVLASELQDSSYTNNGYGSVQELELRSEVGGDSLPLILPGTAFAKSSENSPDLAFNGNKTGGFSSGWSASYGTSMPIWIGFQFDEPQSIVEYMMMPGSHDSFFNRSGFKDWILQGSSDGVSWVDLHTVTNKVWTSPTEEEINTIDYV